MAKTATGKKLRRERLARRRERLGERIDKAYLRWIDAQLCVVPGCQNLPSHHHQPPKSSCDWDDRRTIPACGEHHLNAYPYSIHRLGVKGFEERYGLDVEAIMDDLNARYDAEYAPF